MKKLMVVAIVLALVGCGGGGSAPASTPAPATTSSTPAPSVAAPTSFIVQGRITGALMTAGLTLKCSTIASTGIPCTTNNMQVVADGYGNYTFNNVPGGFFYTITPSFFGYSFSPRDATFLVNANFVGVDFAATACPVNIATPC